MKATAVLIDTPSIQNYIFSSNRLKFNIGASHIVKTLFEEPLIYALNTIGTGNNEWRNNPDNILILNNPDIKWEIGYIGGGNALVFFQNFDDAKNFIQNFSKEILLNYPGLNLAFGIIENFDFNRFPQSIKNLHEILQKNKNSIQPRNALTKFGFTLDCSESNESAEKEFKDGSDYISSVLFAKVNKVQDANVTLQNLLSAELNLFQFPFEFEKISPENEQSYIAVVHIDGNSMGNRFAQSKDLISLRKLSKSVEEATINATKDTVKQLVNLISDKEMLKKLGISISENYLPFRPIIIGGDDKVLPILWTTG